MSESIGSQTPFSSGGHRWEWGGRVVVNKTVSAAGVEGAASIRLLLGPTPGRIVGTLRATGNSVAEADAAMDDLVQVIEDLRASGEVYAWEDDQGRGGESLRVDAFEAGPRRYTKQGSTYTCWLAYTVRVTELDGAPWA